MRSFRVIWNTLIIIKVCTVPRSVQSTFISTVLLNPHNRSSEQINFIDQILQIQTLETEGLCLFPKSLGREETQPGCVSSVLTTTPRCPPRPGQRELPDRRVRATCSYSLCLFALCCAIELHEFKSRPWLLPMFVKHCYLEWAEDTGIGLSSWSS